jgi:hypothetical protein
MINNNNNNSEKEKAEQHQRIFSKRNTEKFDVDDHAG